VSAEGIGKTPGLAVKDVLEGTGMSIAEQLAREVVQNSTDAAVQSSQSPDLKIRFRIVQYPRKILNLLNMDENCDFAKRIMSAGFGELGLNPENVIATRSSRLRALLIEDFGTRGLQGEPENPDSDVHKLLFSLGMTDKDIAEGTGGSYGFGKSVLSRASKLNTVIVYTVYPTDTGICERMIGAAYLKNHSFDHKKWSGWAWFGVDGRERRDDRPVPIEDEHARRLAQQLGFAERHDGAFGTTILLLDLVEDVDSEGLIRGLEKWWWPRLEEGLLDVEVVDEIAGMIRKPEPRKHPEVKHFIEAYRIAAGMAEPAGDHQRLFRARPIENGNKRWNTGRCGFVRVQEVEEQDEESEPELLGRVALIRKPRMVVQYFEPRKRLDFGVAGVFVAHDDIDRFLKLSEPPNHDRWDPGTQRFRSETDRLVKQIVQSVLDHIKRSYREFAQKSRPPRDPSRRLKELERLLGKILRIPEGTSDTSARETDPIHIRFCDGPRMVIDGSGRAHLGGSFEVTLGRDAAITMADAHVRATAAIEEVGRGPRERLPVYLLCENPPVDGQDVIRVPLVRDVPLLVHFETAEFDAEWSASFSVEVEVGGDASS
jgi:hypothetical protein